jgi:hypothetical protein
MAMADLKTKKTEASVAEFIHSVADDTQRKDAQTIDKYMREIVGAEPKMWGASIVGYGSEHLKYDSGRELDWMQIGFSPRKQNITLYVLRGGEDNYHDLLQRLGRHTTGKGCLYIKRLSDVDETVLKQIFQRAIETTPSLRAT